MTQTNYTNKLNKQFTQLHQRLNQNLLYQARSQTPASYPTHNIKHGERADEDAKDFKHYL